MALSTTWSYSMKKRGASSRTSRFFVVTACVDAWPTWVERLMA